MPNSLVGQSIGTTYRQLTHVDGGLESADKKLLDGDGTEASIELGTDNINVATHNGSDKGLKLQGTLLTASATELNQLDNKTVREWSIHSTATMSRKWVHLFFGLLPYHINVQIDKNPMKNHRFGSCSSTGS